MANLELAASCPSDQALALTFAAIQAEPRNAEARQKLIDLLAGTRWYFPATKIENLIPIEHLALVNGSLWVSLSQGNGPQDSNTTIRWNAISLSIQAELFPVKGASTQSITVSPHGRFIVVRRGSGQQAVSLLCDALTMEPIHDLGPLTVNCQPSSVLVFSPDDLLLAHPAADGRTWRICDSATGEMVRSEPVEGQAMAARLDRSALELLMSDGSTTRISLMPKGKVAKIPATSAETVLGAVYLPNHVKPAKLLDRGPNHSPQFVGPDPGNFLQFAWSRKISAWKNLLRDADAPLDVRGNSAFFSVQWLGPLRSSGEITAIATQGNQAFVGTKTGTLEVYKLLPAASFTATADRSPADAASLTALGGIVGGLTGWEFQSTDAKWHRLNDEQRLLALREARVSDLKDYLPEIDFTEILSFIADHPPAEASVEKTKPLWDRIVRSSPPVRPKGGFLNLAATKRVDPFEEVQQVFDSADQKKILAFLETAPGKGPAAAKALELALQSSDPLLINACVESSKDLPPLLRSLAASRIGWLQKRIPEVIALWPEGVPNYRKVRLVENWDGWEQVDFGPAFAALQADLDDELAPLFLPPNSTLQQNQALAERLFSAKTLAEVGKKTHASACEKAARTLAESKETAESAYKLATLALQLGADPPPCLRSQAIALTNLDRFDEAYEKWLSIIIDYPREDQESGDYSEAAFSAFETGKGSVAMDILGKGQSEFPHDAEFALRAGWIALLTDRPEFAYQFLSIGLATGFSTEDEENALCLLAISAAQSGLIEDAFRHFQALTDLNQDWKDPATLEELNWPEGMKATLRQLTW